MIEYVYIAYFSCDYGSEDKLGVYTDLEDAKERAIEFVKNETYIQSAWVSKIKLNIPLELMDGETIITYRNFKPSDRDMRENEIYIKGKWNGKF